MYVYIQSDTNPDLYTVGFYDPNGNWQPESDHRSARNAAEQVAWLNGYHNESSDLPDLEQYCRDFITEKLPQYEDQEIYACDLGNEITQEININGSATFSTKKAREYLLHWYSEAGEHWEYEIVNFGEHIHNPFDNPEKYMVCMIIQKVNDLLAQLSFIDKRWGQKIKLTKPTIKRILSELNKTNSD
jgi:hypothetical protein